MYVEAGTLTASIARAVRQETGASIAPERAGADLLVGVTRGARALDVQVLASSGATIVERQVAVEGELGPAVRVVVLLVAEAIAAAPAPAVASAPPAAVPEAPSWSGRLIAGGRAGWWSTPATPLAGVLLGLDVRRERLQVGLHAGLVACCDLEHPGVLAGSPRIFSLGARGEFLLGEAAGIELWLGGGAGLALRRVRAIALDFAGTARRESHAAPELALQAGLGLERALAGPVALRLAGGVEARIAPLVVTLPEGYAELPLDPGKIGPWVELAAAVRLF